MPKKTKKTTRKVQKKDSPRGFGGLVRKIRVEESYASLFLGFAVVVLIVVLLFSYFGHRNRPTKDISSISTEQLTGQQLQKSLSPTAEEITSTSVPTNVPTVTSVPTAAPTKAELTPTSAPTISIPVQKAVETGGGMYAVKDGDTLWDIAESQLGSGFLWHQIADANKISDPTTLKAGERLAIPKVKSNQIAQNSGSNFQPSINSDSYTIVKGDTLWDIAVRKYGDGFRWVDIAKANNLQNPGLIFSGNVLKLP